MEIIFDTSVGNDCNYIADYFNRVGLIRCTPLNQKTDD
jgi:hypothetical protein